ncbi:MAG: signal peptidase II [Bacilli bacterium]|nr:signal peptidase II [Bacilli bacterium]
MKNREYIYRWVVLVIILDQLTKILIQKNLTLYEEVKVIPKFFSLYYVQNTGAAFSILENATFLLIIISILFVILIDKTIQKEEQNLDQLSILALGMIIGGIFGNLLDRIFYRGVIDFLSFSFGKYHFPVFNVADIGITIGVFLLLFDLWKKRNPKKEETK